MAPSFPNNRVFFRDPVEVALTISKGPILDIPKLTR